MTKQYSKPLHVAAGNRVLKKTPTTETSFFWDALNRMTSVMFDGGEWESAQTMLYRPDGLPHRKVTNYDGIEAPSGYSDFNQDLDNPTTWLRYDGQMTFEEEADVDKRITRNGAFRCDVTR